jgi:hypothetical protein
MALISAAGFLVRLVLVLAVVALVRFVLSATDRAPGPGLSASATGRATIW